MDAGALCVKSGNMPIGTKTGLLLIHYRPV